MFFDQTALKTKAHITWFDSEVLRCMTPRRCMHTPIVTVREKMELCRKAARCARSLSKKGSVRADCGDHVGPRRAQHHLHVGPAGNQPASVVMVTEQE
jgi:hypothetical protein